MRVGFNLPPQTPDGIVHRARLWFFREPPHLAQQLNTMDHGVLAFSEIREQVEFPPGQMDLAPAGRRAELVEIDHDLSELQAHDHEAGAAKHRAYPRLKLLEVERLGHVVVGSELEPFELVGLLISRSQHDDRGASALPNHATEIETVLPRQHDVEEHEVRAEGSHARHGIVAVGNGRDLESTERQVVGQHARERLIVFDDEDSLFHGWCPRHYPTTPGWRRSPVPRCKLWQQKTQGKTV